MLRLLLRLEAGASSTTDAGIIAETLESTSFYPAMVDKVDG